MNQSFTLKKAVSFFLLLTLFIGICYQTSASHVAGGDIEYENIGLRKWKVRLTVYRFCDGANLCPSVNCSQTMTASPSPQITAGGLNPNGCTTPVPSILLSLNLVKVEDTEKKRVERCGQQAKNSCTNLGQVTPGPYKPAIEKYVFEGVLDLSSSGFDNACSYWDMG